MLTNGQPKQHQWIQLFLALSIILFLIFFWKSLIKDFQTFMKTPPGGFSCERSTSVSSFRCWMEYKNCGDNQTCIRILDDQSTSCVFPYNLKNESCPNHPAPCTGDPDTCPMG